MNEQTSVDTASKKIGGQAPATGTPIPADIARKSGSADPIEPASVQIGHDSVQAGHLGMKVEDHSVKGPHVRDHSVKGPHV
jgi:hypothetical protein